MYYFHNDRQTTWKHRCPIPATICTVMEHPAGSIGLAMLSPVRTSTPSLKNCLWYCSPWLHQGRSLSVQIPGLMGTDNKSPLCTTVSPSLILKKNIDDPAGAQSDLFRTLHQLVQFSPATVCFATMRSPLRPHRTAFGHWSLFWKARRACKHILGHSHSPNPSHRLCNTRIQNPSIFTLGHRNSELSPYHWDWITRLLWPEGSWSP
jgi:hypothetical protein